MHVQVHYSNLENSAWTDEFIEKRLMRLERFLSKSAGLRVNLKYERKSYVTSLSIHHMNQDYAFNAEGGNLYESLSLAVDKASRVLREKNKILKDKINRKFFSIKQQSVTGP